MLGLVYTIPQAHACLIERFGRYRRTQTTGIAFKIPIIEQIKSVPINWDGQASSGRHFIQLSEQTTDATGRKCQTLDNVELLVDATVYWRITSPHLSVYRIEDLPSAIADISLNALRSNIGNMKLESIFSNRETLNESIIAQLLETAKKWGVKVTRVEVQEIVTSSETSDAMRQEMEADRRRRADISLAKGQAEAEVEIAFADKAAQVLRAEGKAEAIILVAEAERVYLEKLKTELSSSEASQALIAQKYLDGFAAITKDPGNNGSKIFLPNSFQGLMSLDVDSGRKEM